MKKAVTVTAVVLLIVALASTSFAFNGRGHRGYGGGPCGGAMGDPARIPGLNLTQDQTVKLNDLRTGYLKEVKPLQDKMFSLRGDLRLLWLEKNPDQAKIAAVQKEIRNLRDQTIDKGTAYRISALKGLTPEQQAKFNSYCGRGGFDMGYGPGAGRGPGGGYGPGARNF